MRLSREGLAFIARHEGLRLTAYRDATGVWTIGYGHTSAAGSPLVASGMTISEDEARNILARDAARFEQAVMRRTAHLQPLNGNEFDALVSFAFNLGEGNLARLVRGRDRAEIAAKIPLYDKAGGRRLAGLARRRAEERALFLTPSGEAGMPPDAAAGPGVFRKLVGALLALAMAAAAWLLSRGG